MQGDVEGREVISESLIYANPIRFSLMWKRDKFIRGICTAYVSPSPLCDPSLSCCPTNLYSHLLLPYE